MQLLGLVWAGERGTSQFARALVGCQRPDGGWSQNPYVESDAYATGQVLFALAESGNLKASDPVFQRGIRYLLATQKEDGSWRVKSRAPKVQPYFESGFPYEHHQWISMAGTAWAAIALSFANARRLSWRLTCTAGPCPADRRRFLAGKLIVARNIDRSNFRSLRIDYANRSARAVSRAERARPSHA